jgi:hypothetical protein
MHTHHYYDNNMPPLPHITNLLLVGGTFFFSFLPNLDHNELNEWLTTISKTISIILGLFALCSYGAKFIMWYIRLRNSRRINKNKSGGKL